jgi:DNA-binding CsgD family transcriptional regulator/cell division protein FtsN
MALSRRERQVLDGLVAGQPNKIIAFDLGISPRTVEIYRANLMTKMQAASLSDLVRMALIAGANQNLGLDGKAIEDYSAAMTSQTMAPPLRAVVYYNRGLSQQKLGHLAAAIEDFTSALLLDPELAQAYLSRANVLRLSEQYLFALGDYEKALRYSHAEPHLVLYGQALTYEALSRPLLAQNALARAIKVSPDFQPARDKLLALAGPEAVDLATNGDAAMLEDSQQASLARQRDELLTASLSGARPDVTAIPTELPAAVEPPQGLVEREAEEPRREATAPEALPAMDQPRIEPTGETTQVAALEVAALAQPEAEAGPAQAKAELEGWMVQLSSQRNEDAAWTAWDQLAKRHGELLGGRDAAVVRAELEGKGVFYRLRVHRLQSRNEAQSLCSRLKARGTPCYFGRAEG